MTCVGASNAGKTAREGSSAENNGVGPRHPSTSELQARTRESSWSRLGLSEGDVHIWCAPLDKVEATPFLWNTLSQQERERANGFLLKRDLRRFVVGHAYLRGILGQYTGISPKDIPLASETHGKPSLGGSWEAKRIRFNMTHSTGLALFAVTLDRAIGVDLEGVTRTPGLEEMAARYFSKPERAYIEAFRGLRRRRAFFRVWTRREALAKGMGRGLSGLLDSDLARCDCSQKSTRIGDWQIEGLDNRPGFEAAVARNGPIKRITPKEITEVALLAERQ